MGKREPVALLQLSFLMACDSQCSVAGGLVCDENFLLFHARIQSVLPEGVRFLEEVKDPSTTISGPSSARQRNAI